jgi:hypothetical protein
VLTRNRIFPRHGFAVPWFAAACLLGACSGNNTDSAAEEDAMSAAGTIAAAKRVVNTEAPATPVDTLATNTQESTEDTGAAKESPADNAVQAADAAAAANGGKRNGDRKLDSNKW